MPFDDVLQAARELGYDVRREGPGSFRVQGHGLLALYSEDDEQAWNDLIDGHEDRAKFNAMTPEEKEAFLQAPHVRTMNDS